MQSQRPLGGLSRRTRNTSVLWMWFSTIWVGILVITLIRYWQIPNNSIYWEPVSVWFKMLATLLVITFIVIYFDVMYRTYFGRSSWLRKSDRYYRWLTRLSLLGIALGLNFLPPGEPVYWQGAFVFVGIAWALTSQPEHAVTSVFQVATMAGASMILKGHEELFVGTILYVIAFGVMVAGYVVNNGLINELMVERGRVRDQAVTEERFRLARDLHDTVGHSMTQITLKAELARRLMQTEPNRAQQELVDIEYLSRSLSVQVRQSIAGETALSFANELHRATELLQSMSISVNVQGDPASVSEDADGVFAWCVREGALNVAKHSGATHCDIVLHNDERDSVLTIEDNGTNPASESKSGQGMTGMKQRVQEVGGRVVFTSAEHGHRLEIKIPS